MKIIIIGPSLSGKTTLVRYLRSVGNLAVSEIDEELTKLNNGMFPADAKLKHEIFAPEAVRRVLGQDEVIFFSNTDYFTSEDLAVARGRGFKIVLLSLNLEELLKRNRDRMQSEGYDDLSPWFEGMLDYEKKIRSQNLVDLVIGANLTTEQIASQILKR